MKIFYKNKYKYVEFLGDFSLHGIATINKFTKKN